MSKQRSNLPTLTKESDLKRRIRKHLRDLGYRKSKDGNLVPPESTKNSIRNVHAIHRTDVLKRNADFANRNLPKLKNHFASGHEVNPSKIQPRLQLIRSNTWESALFRLATLPGLFQFLLALVDACVIWFGISIMRN